MTEENRTAPLGLRIRPSLKAALQALADKEKRTLAAFVELVLEERVASSSRSKPRR